MLAVDRRLLVVVLIILLRVVLVDKLSLAVLLRKQISFAVAHFFVFSPPVSQVLLQKVHDELRLCCLLFVYVGDVTFGFVKPLLCNVHSTLTLFFLL